MSYLEQGYVLFGLFMVLTISNIFGLSLYIILKLKGTKKEITEEITNSNEKRNCIIICVYNIVWIILGVLVILTNQKEVTYEGKCILNFLYFLFS